METPKRMYTTEGTWMPCPRKNSLGTDVQKLYAYTGKPHLTLHALDKSWYEPGPVLREVHLTNQCKRLSKLRHGETQQSVSELSGQGDANARAKKKRMLYMQQMGSWLMGDGARPSPEK